MKFNGVVGTTYAARKMLTFVVGLLFLVLLAAGASASSKEEKKEGDPSLFSLDTFILNIRDIKNNRFLKMSICIDLSNPALAERAKARNAALRDAVIMLVTQKTTEEILSPEGKLVLKEELSLLFNHVLGDSTVKGIYFTDFVTQ